ncbi:MAG TPA: hypothetical protein DGG95_13005 [Cytophagales bacterium]|jgi:hypothetical protein|nr:hypothetical protein [Cytophagales bacterium]
MLERVPPPSVLDEQLRTKREPMLKDERRKFIHEFAPGIVLFVFAYTLLTIFRDFRDNFFAELLQLLGYKNSPEIFTQTEIPITIIVLAIMGSLMLIRNNFMALMTNLVLIIIGLITIGFSTLLFENGWVSPLTWMSGAGLGLYLGYVPFNSILFDRMLATFKIGGTVGFIMYIADAFGYLGSVGVLFLKEFSLIKISWLVFFIRSGYFISITGSVMMILCAIYFYRKHKRSQMASKT